jgi:hypothetical protein
MHKSDHTSTGFDSSRFFVQWFYTKSHSRLLLWSEQGNTERTRIELLFLDVAVINIPVYMRGLKITPLKGREVQAELARVPVQQTRDKVLFRMSGTDWEGYVIAASLTVAEAERSFDAPSDLLDPLWSSPFPR